MPITNSRYALNAANARWGSLYDYGTDVLDHCQILFLMMKTWFRCNKICKRIPLPFPLENSTWKEIVKIDIDNNSLIILDNQNRNVKLEDTEQYFGYRINQNNKISELILEKNNLKIRILLNKDDKIGSADPANIADIIFESAISTIMDCEDSVATVDAEDKILAYKNWLGLMKGDLKSTFTKNNKTLERLLNKDIDAIDKYGKEIIIKGRSLMLIRNVGHLMTNPAILDNKDNEIPEGLMDAMLTSLIALYDLNKKSSPKNSEKKSIYIVKPKMHGPEEVAFACKIFDKVEGILKLEQFTVKLGIMDEERRTSVNLLECIRVAKHRVAFINTGFLDRTGDEIHTSMEAGPFLKKGDMKTTNWIKSYEERNVDIGLQCGLQGKAQIGKGMWAMPDLMKDMLEKKIEHPLAGANCAWVPSPTAATIHAMHYHFVDVKKVQNKIVANGRRGSLEHLLEIPIAKQQNWNKEEVIREVENNSQSILGYVVSGLIKELDVQVPDINDIGLMEDRATCRISSQILANWLKHK